MTRLTAPLIDWEGRKAPAVECFQAGTAFQIGDLEVRSFTIPHDAVDPVGFTISSAGVRWASRWISAICRSR
jgi:hypothetical protein